MAFASAVILNANSTPKPARRVALYSLRFEARAETPKPEHSELDMMRKVDSFGLKLEIPLEAECKF
jgi:hypothetical protein